MKASRTATVAVRERHGLRDDDAVDLAFRFRSCVHGAVSLELQPA